MAPDRSPVPSSAPPATFLNPILPGFNPDPTVCAVPAAGLSPSAQPPAAVLSHFFAGSSTPSSQQRAKTWFFLSTSTFEYFPGAALFASPDLLNWIPIGHALTCPATQLHLRTVEPGAGSWASTLRYRPEDGRWYLANGIFQRYRPTVDERIFPRGFYVSTDNIWDEKSWSDPVFFDNPGFDQDLFWHPATSRTFLSTTMRLARRPANSKQKDFAIHISEIDLSTGRTLTPPEPIRVSPHGIAEGSHIFCRGDYYYLLTAEGGTEAGHQEWVFRSREGPLGPWEKMGSGDKPLWYNGPGEEVQRTGHADVFEDGEGRWWAVLLGVRPVEGGDDEPQLGRQTFLVTVDWEDDWPVFNGGKNITLLTQGRDPGIHQWDRERAASAADKARDDTYGSSLIWKADFDKEELEIGWYHKNTPLKPNHTLLERPGRLRLYGNCFNLSSPESPAMLLRKQGWYDERVTTRFGFRPRARAGYEAGLVLWWSPFSYATVGVGVVDLGDGRAGETVRTLVMRRPTGRSGEFETTYPYQDSAGNPAALPTDDDDENSLPFTLSLECCARRYTLSITSGAGTQTHRHAIDVDPRDLTTAAPVGVVFAAAMYGVYAFGHGEPVLDPAEFADFVVLDA